jgi:hypothetical protein
MMRSMIAAKTHILRHEGTALSASGLSTTPSAKKTGGNPPIQVSIFSTSRLTIKKEDGKVQKLKTVKDRPLSAGRNATITAKTKKTVNLNK